MTYAQLMDYLDSQGLTVPQFAALIGVHFSAVYRWRANGEVPEPVALFIGLAISGKIPLEKAAAVSRNAVKSL